MWDQLVMALLLPFIAWDAARYLLRRRGDRSAARRQLALRHFTEQDIAVGRSHTLEHNRLFPISRALFYLLFGALLMGGIGARAEAWVLGLVGGSWALALPLLLLLLLLSHGLLHLPLAAYSEFVIQRRAGLSNTSAPLWLADQAKGLALGWVLGTALALPVMALVRWLPASWPLPATAAVLALSAFTVWISPWVIAPLFNRFTPLDDQLAQQVRQLTERAGLKVRQVYVCDASRRSSMLNAYFTGLGNSRRVVLFDTLVQACDEAEVLSVVGHELGHWRGRHIAKGFLAQALGTAAGLLALQALLHSPGLRAALGLPAPDSLVLLVLLPFVASLAGTLAAPLGAAMSRRFERQADQTAFQLTADPAAFIRLEQRLVRRAKADLLLPRALHSWYGTHPLPEDRIAAAEAFAAKLCNHSGGDS